MDWRTMPSWDALRYFNPPVETVFSSTNSGQLVLAADPRRVLAVFSVASSTTVNISPNSGGLSPRGIQLTQTNPYVVMDWYTWGPLLTGTWYFVSTVLTNFTVMSVSMIEFPSDTDDPHSHMAVVQPQQPAQQITTAPGVGGRQGVIDYWRSKMAQILGGK